MAGSHTESDQVEPSSADEDESQDEDAAIDEALDTIDATMEFADGAFGDDDTSSIPSPLVTTDLACNVPRSENGGTPDSADPNPACSAKPKNDDVPRHGGEREWARPPSKPMRSKGILEEPGGSEPVRLWLKKAEEALSKGHTELAVEFGGRALDLQRRDLGPKHISVATTLCLMGDAVRSQGRNLKLAVELYKKALAIRNANLGRHHVKVACTHYDIAGTYEDIPDHGNALEHYQHAHAIFKRAHGEWHPDIAATHNSVAFVHVAKRELTDALEHFGKALVIQKQTLGERHPDIADTCSNIAVAYTELDKVELALKFHTQSLLIRKQAFGPEHESVASCYNNQGVVHEKMGRLEVALNLYHKALGLRQRLFGHMHPSVADSQTNIAGVLAKTNSKSEARAYFLSAFRVYRAKYGDSHRCTQQARRGAVALYNTTGGGECATPIRESLALFEKKSSRSNGGDASDSLTATNAGAVSLDPTEESEDATSGDVWATMALSYLSDGKPKLAANFYKMSLTKRRGAFGEKSTPVAESYIGISTAFLAIAPESLEMMQRRCNVALKCAVKGLDTYLERDMADHENAMIAFRNVSKCYNNIAALHAHPPTWKIAYSTYEKGIDALRRVMQKANMESSQRSVLARELADAQNALHRYKDALQSLSDSLVGVGTETVEHIETYRSLAGLCCQLAKFDDAFTWGSTVLKLRKEIHGETDKSVASDLVLLGDIARDQGKYLAKAGYRNDEVQVNYARAMNMYVKAHEIHLELFGPSHLESTRSQMMIADIYELQGVYEAEEAILKSVMDTLTQSLGPTHVEIAAVQHKIGNLHRCLEQYPKALECYQEAIAMWSKERDTRVEMADACKDSSVVHIRAGNFDRAIQSLHAALRITQEGLGPNHPAGADICRDIGETYELQAKYALAFDFYKKCLAIREGNQSNDRLEHVEALGNMARAHRVLRRVDAAVPLYERTIASAAKAFGERHWTVAERCMELGSLHLESESPRLALEQYRRAWMIFSSSLGPRHPKALAAQRCMAESCVVVSDFDQAWALYSENLEVGVEVLGEAHLDNVLVRCKMADVENRRAEREKAVELYLQVIGDMSKCLGENHPELVTVYARVGFTLSAQGMYHDANDFYRQALCIDQHTSVGESSTSAQLLELMGDCAMRAKNYERASKCFHDALQTNITLFGECSAEVAKDYLRIASATKALGQYGEATEFCARAARVSGVVTSPKSVEVATAIFEMGECISADSVNSLSRALIAYEKVHEIYTELLGSTDPRLEIVNLRIGDTLMTRTLRSGERAVEFYKAAARINKATPEHSRSRPEVFHKLAKALIQVGSYQEAVGYLKEAVRLKILTLGENHPDLAPIYMDIAQAYSKSGKKERASELFQHATKLCERHHVAGTDQMTFYERMGEMFFEATDYATALQNYQKVLDAQVEKFGPRDGRTADTYGKIAAIHRQTGKLLEARDMYYLAIDIKKTATNVRPGDVGCLIGDVADVYYELGDDDLCLKNYKDALQHVGGVLPRSSLAARQLFSKGCEAFDRIAEKAREQCKLQEAEELCSLSWSLRMKDLGDKDPGMARTLRIYASLHSDRGEVDDAIRTFGKSIMSAREACGDPSRELVATYEAMADHYLLWQEFEVARHYYQLTMDTRQKFEGWRSTSNLRNIVCLTLCAKHLLREHRHQRNAPRSLYTLACLWRCCEGYEKAFELFGKVTMFESSDRKESRAFYVAANENMAGVHVLQQATLGRRTFSKALSHFKAALQCLRKGSDASDPLVAEGEAWIAELSRIKHEAESKSYASWKVIPQVEMRKALDVSVIKASMLMDLHREPDNACAAKIAARMATWPAGELSETHKNETGKTSTQKIKTSVLRLIATKLIAAIGAEDFTFENFLGAWAGHPEGVSLPQLQETLREMLGLTPMELSNAHLTLVFQFLDAKRKQKIRPARFVKLFGG